MIRTAFGVSLALLAAGCTPAPGSDVDASARDAASIDTGLLVDTGVTVDTGAPVDTGLPVDAHRAESDAGPSTSHPPEGSRLCGEGTLTQDELRATCTATDPSVFGIVIEKTCDALTTAGLDYEIWCTPDQLYVFARLREVDSASRLTCGGSVPLPDGGVFLYETRELPYGIDSPPPESPILVTVDGATHVSSAGGTPASWSQTIVGDPVSARYERTMASWTRPDGATVSFDAGGTTTFALPLTPVDCTGFTPTGPTTYVFIVRLDWDAT